MVKNKINTIHTARTIMFAELSKVMDYSMEDENYIDSLGNNIIGKKSADGIRQTTNFLKKLYSFNTNEPSFRAFKYFWKITDQNEKSLISLVYAINYDELLAESIYVLNSVAVGDKVAIDFIEENIEKYHPERYTPNTRKSMAQNIASSWKQAGFIEGKVKNIRTQPKIGYKVIAFALFIAYLKGHRGDFILNSIGIKALCLSEDLLREQMTEASKAGLLQYQFAGNITSIVFNYLLNELGIDGN